MRDCSKYGQHHERSWRESKRSAWMKVTPNYNETNVLLGNWVEDRWPGQKDIWKATDFSDPSNYKSEYKTAHKLLCSPSVDEKDKTWRIVFRNEGNDFGMHLGNQDAYLKNMASSYDLQYRHCIRQETEKPEIAEKMKDHNTLSAHQCNKNDYTIPYGNITQFGLREYKNYIWERDRNDIKEIKSTYQTSYGMPTNSNGQRDQIRKLCPSHRAKLNENHDGYRGQEMTAIHNAMANGLLQRSLRRRAYLRCGQL